MLKLQRGRYTSKSINLERYIAPVFRPALFKTSAFSSNSCGQNALAIVTGLKPSSFPKKEHYSDNLMVSILRKLGYTIIPLTVAMLTNNEDFLVNRIKKHHVLLVSQMMLKNEGSWCVTYGGVLFHNFEIDSVQPLEFINRPIMSAYIVFHTKWNRSRRYQERKGSGKKAKKKLR